MAAIRRLGGRLHTVSHASAITLTPLQYQFHSIPLFNAVHSLFQGSFLVPTAAPIALIPSNLVGLWEGLLRAVQKKKVSHRKKRQKLLAGKALQDVTALNKCSACGAVKRAHFLCPACIEAVRKTWNRGSEVAERN